MKNIFLISLRLSLLYVNICNAALTTEYGDENSNPYEFTISKDSLKQAQQNAANFSDKINADASCNYSDSCDFTYAAKKAIELQSDLAAELNKKIAEVKQTTERECTKARRDFQDVCSAKFNLKKQELQPEMINFKEIESQYNMEAQDQNKDVIETAIAKLTAIQNKLETINEDLRQIYNDCDMTAAKKSPAYQMVEALCIEPEIIPENATPQSRFDVVLPTKTYSDSEINGMAKLKSSIPVQSEIVKNNIEVAQSSSASTQFEVTTITASNAISISEIETAINNLAVLRGDKPIESRNSNCTGLTGCDDPATPGPNDVRPVARPTTVTTPTVTGKEAVNPTSTGVTADSIIADTQGAAYGASPNGTANDATTSGSSGNGSWLSGLGSMFKTGSFGDDDSYGSNRSGSRYASNSGNSGSGGYNLPTDNAYDYNDNLNAKNSNQFNDGQRGFRSQTGGTFGDRAQNPNSYSGGNLSAINGSGGKNANSDSKPGFLSRLFGKKDKTFLGKNISGSSAGGGLQDRRSGSNYRGSLDKNGLPIGNAKDKRVFDPSKYAPSKAAQERAYARSTGRKIASHSSLDANGFEWPSYIIKASDKRGKESVFNIQRTAYKLIRLAP